jgi:hypothetical protein
VVEGKLWQKENLWLNHWMAYKQWQTRWTLQQAQIKTKYSFEKAKLWSHTGCGNEGRIIQQNKLHDQAIFRQINVIRNKYRYTQHKRERNPAMSQITGRCTRRASRNFTRYYKFWSQKKLWCQWKIKCFNIGKIFNTTKLVTTHTEWRQQKLQGRQWIISAQTVEGQTKTERPNTTRILRPDN